MELLRGATQTIERDHPAVLCEVTPDALRHAGSGLEEILEFFRTRGYQAEDPIVSDQRIGIQTLDYAELPEFFRQFEYSFYNILFRLPGDRASITS
jgi:hypothetical protein